MQQFDVLIKFRRDAAKVYGEPSEALSHPEIADEMVIISTFHVKDRSSYCRISLSYYILNLLSLLFLSFVLTMNSIREHGVPVIAVNMESKQGFRMRMF